MTQVANGLWVGNLDEAFDKNVLKTAGITHILNVASELEFTERVGMIYDKIAVDDDSYEANIETILPCALSHIRTVIQNGGIVMVHCLEGKSRSICVVLAYMIIDCGMTLEASQAFLKSRRSIDIFPFYLTQTLVFCKTFTLEHHQ